MLPLKLLDGVSLVGGGVVQQHDQRAAQVAQQFAQEAADLLLADVVEEKQIIETQSTPPRAEGNAGDDTDLVSPSLAVTMNGCLPLRRQVRTTLVMSRKCTGACARRASCGERFGYRIRCV